ncbi:MAG: hypothetical protein V9G14_13775 [Cypionkella sp.]
MIATFEALPDGTVETLLTTETKLMLTRDFDGVCCDRALHHRTDGKKRRGPQRTAIST